MVTGPGLVIREQIGAVEVLTLNRPDKRNALNAPLREARTSPNSRAAFLSCFGAADRTEGIAAFLEKRPARFPGT